MTDQELLQLAQSEGFQGAFIAPEEIPINGEFRAFCEENRCGRYGANYSCPPDCGTVEEMQNKLLSEDRVLVIQTIREIAGYNDKETIMKSKSEHNAAVLRLMKKFQENGYAGFCSGYNGCSLCDPCKRQENQPCLFPSKRISCLSAYCVDVAQLAKQCHLAFAWDPNRLHLFGIIAFHENESVED